MHPGLGFLGSSTRGLSSHQTRVGWGTEEQGRMIPAKQAQETQAIKYSTTYLDQEAPDLAAKPSLSLC